eukprot:gene12953-5978_t
MDIVGNSMSQLTDRVLLTSRAAARLVGHYTARHLIPRHSPTSTAIPVAGFDKEAVQELYFTLQQCADIERNIVFWEGQLNGGELNMLLSNGPIACFRHVSLALHLRNAGPDDVSATYRLQRRTRMLKAARALLAEALANVCKAAATLRVQHRSKDSMSPPTRLLKAAQALLAEALANVSKAAATLRVQHRSKDSMSPPTRLLKAARALLAEALANVCKAAATLRVQHRSKDSMSPPVIANLQTPRRKDDDALLETARLACHSCLPTLSTTLVSLQLAVKESRYSSYKAVLQQAALERSASVIEAVLQQAALERSASVIEYEQERFKNLGSALATLDSFIHMPTNFLDDDIPDTEGVT